MIMSSLSKSGKSTGVSSSPVGFRFHTNDEELEELKSDQEKLTHTGSDMNLELKSKPTLLTLESTESKSDEDKSDAIGDTVRDFWHLLGRKSASVDSNYESPFSNPIETLKKLNELKGKITKKTVEKISEGKLDRNGTGSSSRGKLFNSKENSSISDSEDTSESSKLSESLKDNEEQNLFLKKVKSKNSELLSSTLEATVQKVKAEMESEAELRNRKNMKFSELLKPADIKIAVPRKDTITSGSLFQESLDEEVESGVEADENLDPSESDSLEIFDDTFENLESSQTPPPGGSNTILRVWNNFDSLTSPETFILMVTLGLYVLLPMPDFVRGFVFCLCCILLCMRIKTYFQVEDLSCQSSKPFVMPDYNSLPPLKVPEYKPDNGVWVNEYIRETYHPDYYSVTHTLPAYLELDKNLLKISRPKGKINKRATFDEPKYKLQFVSQRVYNISGCNVFLMPDGLTRKRLFSKKYPIVIFLRPDSLISIKRNGKNIDDKEKQFFVDDDYSQNNIDDFTDKINLYIFARCDRQKEEWYRRLLTASRYSSNLSVQKKKEILTAASEEKENVDNSTSEEALTPFENLFFENEVVQLEEYLRYMSKVVDIEAIRQDIKYVKSRHSWYKKLKKKRDALSQESSTSKYSSFSKSPTLRSLSGKSKPSLNTEKTDISEKEICSSFQIQWFSAFINRILFDIFRSPYWLEKIHEKVQRKLNSIRLPYYIEDIEVIEMDLGKTGPVFHRVSQPYLDERGLWFDMDTTYEGLIKLTIQTHLNLIKLQQGMAESTEFSDSEKMEKTKKLTKEVKDPSLTKESQEKSNQNLLKKARKIEKKSTNPSSSILKKITKLEKPPKKSGSERHLSQDRKLLDEVARFAEIAIEEGLNNVVENTKRGKKSKKQAFNAKKKRSPIYDSEVEDSAESSDDNDEEEEEIPAVSTSVVEKKQSYPRRYPRDRRSSKKLFRVFENVAQSKYFKSMAQSKYVQKAIAGVSATKLRLTLEIKSCTGTLTINIPPPPSDRFWYGFREMPKMVFSANPKIGGKAVRFVHIKNYLQKKILHEIKKAMVVPNMVDFVLPTSSPAQSSVQVEQPLQDEEDSTPSQEEK